MMPVHKQQAPGAHDVVLSQEDERLLAHAEELLCLTDADLQALKHGELMGSIEDLRATIRQVTSRLIALGDSSLQQPPSYLALLPPLPPRTDSLPLKASTISASADDKAAAAGRESSVEPHCGPRQEPCPNLGQGEDAGGDVTLGCVDDLDPSEWQVPPFCIPIHANIVTFNWRALYEAAQFDVIMMDPPWQLATANPTRGIALGYSQLCDQDIANIPIPELQRQGGFLFVWVINAKYKWMLDQFDKWGYRVVDEIVWVKTTVNRRLAKSHGYYLQHAKEVCLVARRGKQDPPGTRRGGVASDVIFSMRRGNSQKPTEIYEIVEELVPGGHYLEIFARKNNLRNYWVSLGNEVTGTGLPQEDLDAIREGMDLPGAVYGRAGGKP